MVYDKTVFWIIQVIEFGVFCGINTVWTGKLMLKLYTDEIA